MKVPLPGNGDISTAPALLFSLRCVILFGRKLLLHKMRGKNEHIAVTDWMEGRAGVERRVVQRRIFGRSREIAGGLN